MTRQGDPIRRHPPRSLQERAEAALEVLKALSRANEEGWPVVVEGPNDESALRELGVTGEIVRLNRGSSVLITIEELAARHGQDQPAPPPTATPASSAGPSEPLPSTTSLMPTSPTTPTTPSTSPAPGSQRSQPPLPGFILLTDWDRTGGQLARRLREAGKACGLKADSEYRRRLVFYTGSQIRCVEDLPGFLKRGLTEVRTTEMAVPG